MIVVPNPRVAGTRVPIAWAVANGPMFEECSLNNRIKLLSDLPDVIYYIQRQQSERLGMRL